jgi:hypothetical protein
MLATIQFRIFCLPVSLSLSLSKNLKIKTYAVVILPVVLYGCESNTNGRTQIEGGWEQDAEENIWT